ncbi:hypothetical protein [Streptomyces sp. NBC_00338]|uniref:hypothetical protein n=1 Tax=Streptomyces sp. NBC_00338 TaxID=2975715 RepID=UPI00225B42E6|nr:hypothetical protein [Streptomyces sp. NBC_00338]MCX5138375.1 hypothetical protein [Streptomyces sp. NBC_00338]MCX5145164.1 hypothetical protein [Streptomyces sp. NBC_00338]
MTDRTEYIAGLRELANWLEINPTGPFPSDNRLLVPLVTNDAVAAFATEYGASVTTNKDDNTSAELRFGSLTYYAYGYADFTDHLAKQNEKQARAWAEKQGLELCKAGESA